MPLINDNTGTGDAAIKNIISPELEAKRMELRRKLIAARGSSYTYKDPDGVAGRAGASIGDNGAITIGLQRSRFIGGSGGLDRSAPTINGVAAHGLGTGETGNQGNGIGSIGGAGPIGSGPSTSTASARRNFVGPRISPFELLRRKLKGLVKKPEKSG